jgi:hypothetical protein
MSLAEMSSMGIGNKPCLDIKPSADQISNRSISIAQLSKSEYETWGSFGSEDDVPGFDTVWTVGKNQCFS